MAWYGVRSVVHFSDHYEERVVVFDAVSSKDAIV